MNTLFYILGGEWFVRLDRVAVSSLSPQAAAYGRRAAHYSLKSDKRLYTYISLYCYPYLIYVPMYNLYVSYIDKSALCSEL